MASLTVAKVEESSLLSVSVGSIRPLSFDDLSFHLLWDCKAMLIANSDSTVAHSASAVSPLSAKKENVTPASTKIAELTESRQELLNRIESLKTDLQSWRLELDGQVKVYRDELSDLKKSLNVDVEQLRSEFQELKTALQQQQEDITASLRNLGLQDVSEETKEAEDADAKLDNNEENAQDLQNWVLLNNIG